MQAPCRWLWILREGAPLICFCVSNVKAIQLADSSNGERKEYYLSFLLYFCVFSDQLACNVSGISHQTNARCVPVSVPTPGPLARPRKRGQEGMVRICFESDISTNTFSCLTGFANGFWDSQCWAWGKLGRFESGQISSIVEMMKIF